jgi:hypothetical protein
VDNRKVAICPKDAFDANKKFIAWKISEECNYLNQPVHVMLVLTQKRLKNQGI